GAKDLLARKTAELFGRLYHPGFAQVFDSRQRINIRAMHPQQYPAIPAYADGTDNHPGGPALVGERGPEIVHLPRGSKVSPRVFGPQLGDRTGQSRPGVEEYFHRVLHDSGSAHLTDPRRYSKQQENDLYAMRLNRYLAPTGTGREMGNSAAFNEWAKGRTLHHPSY